MNTILAGIIRKTDTSMALAFDKAIKEKIKDSVDTERQEVSKDIFCADKPDEDIHEISNTKIKYAIRKTVEKWQKLGPADKNLDKAIATITKNLKVDKKELKQRILNGDLGESEWIIDNKKSEYSNFEHFCDIVETRKSKEFKLDGKKTEISFTEAKTVINFMQSLALTSVHKFKDVLDRDVTSINKVIKMIRENLNG